MAYAIPEESVRVADIVAPSLTMILIPRPKRAQASVPWAEIEPQINAGVSAVPPLRPLSARRPKANPFFAVADTDP